jgi:hypothetical protein
MEDKQEAVIAEKEAWFRYLERTIQESFLPSGYDIPRAEYFFFMLSLPESS